MSTADPVGLTCPGAASGRRIGDHRPVGGIVHLIRRGLGVTVHERKREP